MLPLPSIYLGLVVVDKFFSKALEGSNIILKSIYFQTWTIPAPARWALVSLTRSSFPTELVILINHSSDCWDQHYITNDLIVFLLVCFNESSFILVCMKADLEHAKYATWYGVLACAQYFSLCTRSPLGLNMCLGGMARRSSLSA